MATPCALPVATELFADRYHVRERLGSGGAADVLRAHDHHSRQDVALKVLRPTAEEGAAERFVLEGRALAGLDHPGLVTVHDGGSWGGLHYLALELVEGPTLRQLLARDALSPASVAGLGAALARTLAFVHGHGIVHRDVKPSNVLLDRHGTPRLADFGIARLPGDAELTRTGLVVGTPAYLSPEQIRGRRARPASDVYALGLVLLECLTGRREYGGAPLEAAAARLHRPPRIPGRLPHSLARLLRRMTATEPDRRPSADECARTLAELAAVPAPPQRHRHARRPERRPVAVLTAAATTLLSLTGLTDLAGAAAHGAAPAEAVGARR
ncbi:serine/threonine-protein kinase [Kitasatospora sp. NPDC096147]|uniref:serine/threonine-protein kinase n=1 Tax=Kitasatospora sp. NPDC096147 TaxID=3364093 RepID=UPI0037F91930